MLSDSQIDRQNRIKQQTDYLSNSRYEMIQIDLEHVKGSEHIFMLRT